MEQVFEYNPDEGTSLIKSVLFLDGFPLYEKIFNDQPPLFTVMLSFWMKLFGASVYYGRMLVLLFGCLFLWALYGTVKNYVGRTAGIIAAIFLLLSTAFLRLSVSLMLGTPSLAMAMLAVYFISVFRLSARKYFLVFSGLTLGIAAQIKFAPMFLFPVILWEILRIEKDRSPGSGFKKLLPAMLLWFGSFLVVYGTITLIFFHGHFGDVAQQIFQPHVQSFIQGKSSATGIWRMLLSDYDIVLLAIMSVLLIFKSQRRCLFFPMGWIFMAGLIFTFHRPIWHHYYLYISVPVCWLAGSAIQEFFQNKEKRNGWIKWGMVILILITIVRLPTKYLRTRQNLNDLPQTTEERTFLELLAKHKSNIHWLVTDRPIFAFYAGLQVPPELALISRKRNFVAPEAQDYFINKVKKYQPEAILIQKDPQKIYFGSKVLSYIQQNYTLIYEAEIPRRFWKNKMQQVGEDRNRPGIFHSFHQWDDALQLVIIKGEFYHKKLLFEFRKRQYQPYLTAFDWISKELEVFKTALTLSLDMPLYGQFSLKPYTEVSDLWKDIFPNERRRSFVYSQWQKVFEGWQEQERARRFQIRNEEEAITLRITRLKSLQNQAQKMKKSYLSRLPIKPDNSWIEKKHGLPDVMYPKKLRNLQKKNEKVIMGLFMKGDLL